ncbi:MAG: NAD-dependent DNA ligase LigA [Flavobacteriales bacterium]|jgi:DNA ligase (NAD+)|tara:strand:- start:27796 stop:29805 length:2010 start_codon:yes stop_codon:yes gene_type:complete
MNLVQQNIEQLRDELHRHNYNYYVLDKSVISDFDFDIKLKQLKVLENQFPEFNDDNSPTKRVGGSVVKSFNSVTHQYPMYSLDNSYSKKDLEDWNQRLIKNSETDDIKFLCELKFDGVSINLTYENGILIKAVTRGDGVQGDDVIENIKTIKTIPLKLKGSFPEKFQIRGEIIIDKNDFAEMNIKRVLEGLDPYMNPRNTASGSLKLQDSSETAKRPLKCFLYQIVTEDNDIKTQNEYLISALDWGFNISNTYKLCNNLSEVVSYINYWDKERLRLNFEIDGIVIKVNNIKFQKQLGYTSKYPRWSIAYKFKTEQVLTKLLNVSYQVGRTGAITPVANLESVLLGGTYVKRASLHNQDQINKLDLYIQDHVFIEKGGEIIPKIVGIDLEKRDPDSEKIKFIDNCPSCGDILVRNESESQHYCLNMDNCAPQIMGRIQHFISRKAMDVNGIGNETIDLLYKNGLILNYADLYDLKKEDLILLERMAEKSIDNIFSGLEESRKIGFERVLFALGIRHVGQTVARKLAKEFKSIDKLISMNYENLLLVDEVGERISESIIAFFNNNNNNKLIERLKKFGLQFEIYENDENLNDVLTDYRFVISGVFETNSRDELKKIIEDNGGKVLSSLTSKTNYLLGGDNIGPSKLLKANSFGISIISENDLKDLINSKPL